MKITWKNIIEILKAIMGFGFFFFYVVLIACGITLFSMTYNQVYTSTEPADLLETIGYCVSLITIAYGLNGIRRAFYSSKI